MLRLFLVSVFILQVIICQSQATYKQSAGVRLGATSGLTFKKLFYEEEAIEVILSGRRDGIQLNLLYVFHEPMEISFNENFFAYYGLGGHVGYERYGRLSKTLISVDPPRFLFDERSYYVMGVDGLLGIEYRWLSVPVTIGFDVKPYINFIGLRYTRAKFWDSALSIKYVF